MSSRSAMRAFSALSILGIGLFAARVALGAWDATGAWVVTTEGAFATECIATVVQTGANVSASVTCRRLGLSLVVTGQANGGAASGSGSGQISWTAQRSGSRLVGTFESPLGSGTWSAERR